ncbi:SDR family oxidoreductase [Gordonia sp. Z-3]|uniref:SDR family oxidoreductase n=1 Tax=Gordonia tangerina TaxID=2911060 RepID=A0ABS9DDU9_9ACTN|nr:MULTISPECIES: SDR family oxidoreductase [Gordonia]MCF3937303.1 SDR family oxidoreductase [Gordonia tangerina]MED5802855.1 SDR family oxidoreductase [Gordonia sp. Z-3]
MDYRDKTVLIAGASGGIGAAFATGLAARGANVILVARNEAKLKELATDLHDSHGIRAEYLAADLSEPCASDDVVEELDRRGLAVDILVNNAGFGMHADFADSDPARIRDAVALNVGVLTDLCAVYMSRMTQLGAGAIINVASVAAFQPVPHLAVYAATKAYVLSLSEALWWEGKQNGVKVLAVCPGATDTGFFEAAGANADSVGPRRSTSQVVNTALRALDAGKPSLVDGLYNLVVVAVSQLVPRRLALAVAELAVRPSAQG